MDTKTKLSYNLKLFIAIAVLQSSAIIGCSKKAPLGEHNDQNPITVKSGTFENQKSDQEYPNEQEIAAESKRLGISEEHAKNLIARELEFFNHKLPNLIQTHNGGEELKTFLMKRKQAIAIKTPTAKDPSVANGSKLPSDFIDLFMRPAADSPASITMKTGFMGIDEEQLYDQQTLGILCRELTTVRPEIVASFLQGQAGSLPPTASDYIIYGAILDGLKENPLVKRSESGRILSTDPPTANALLNLSQAKNPVYRMLSIEVAPYVEPDKEKLVSFYSSFLAESDSTIQMEAVEGLAATDSKGSTDVLKNFEATARQKGNTDLANAAAKAIRQNNRDK